MDATTLRGKPELFLDLLCKSVEEISTTSDANTSQPDALQEVESKLNLQVKVSVKNLIEGMWKECDIANKSLYLYDEEIKNPPHSVTWRPTTGEVPILSIKGNYLTCSKAKLLHKIEKSKCEAEQLQAQLGAKKLAFEKSYQRVCKTEEVMPNLLKEYEKIVIL